MLIDTHAHLWFPDYYPPRADQPDYYDDLNQVLQRAKAAGIMKVIVPGTDIESSKKAVELSRRYPGVIYASVGVHPEELVSHNLQNHKSSDLSFASLQTALRSELGDLAAGEQVVAIGEIGTDASTEELKNCMEEQKELFREQCMIAIEHDLPVIIHTRESFKETWEVLASLPKLPRGQFHCFSVDEEALKVVIENGFYVSFCGNITWSKRVAKLVSLVPDDRLLLETDSPLMVPRDKKGEPVQWNKSSELEERNEPANVLILAEKIVELRGQTIAQIEEITTKNANALYKL